jgi:hypothetical protein
MTNVGEFRDSTSRHRRRDRGVTARFEKPAEETPREVPPPSGLMLTAMLAQRVRVKLADGVHWMSGYDALASVLSERSAAGDARASMLLENLTKYSALRDARHASLQVAPQTEAEKALADAFVRRTIDGLTTRKAAKAGRKGSVLARTSRRRERAAP